MLDQRAGTISAKTKPPVLCVGLKSPSVQVCHCIVRHVIRTEKLKQEGLFARRAGKRLCQTAQAQDFVPKSAGVAIGRESTERKSIVPKGHLPPLSSPPFAKPTIIGAPDVEQKLS